jgi:outer membrane protein OmpA-like peptidoglycan-associated protein
VKDSNGKPLSADLKWEDLKSGKNVGILKSNPTDGSYIILLPLGKLYGYYAERSGFYPTSKNIDLRKAKNDTTIIEDIILVSLLQMKEEKTKVRINNIFFDFDEYYLLPESFPELDRLAAILLKDTKQKVEIDGHTDIIGKAEYNVDLSLKRAQTVRDYLVSKGLDESRFIVKGFGTSKPVADNTTEEGRSQNRRVEIWFVE